MLNVFFFFLRCIRSSKKDVSFEKKITSTSVRCVLYQNNATVNTECNEFEFWYSDWWDSTNVSAILREREQHTTSRYTDNTQSTDQPTDQNIPKKHFPFAKKQRTHRTNKHRIKASDCAASHKREAASFDIPSNRFSHIFEHAKVRTKFAHQAIMNLTKLSLATRFIRFARSAPHNIINVSMYIW